MAFATNGSHLLLPDSVYFPARRVCDELLRDLGVETTFYDPCIGAGIAALIRDNTALIYLESPGSLTFEMQDVPAIVAAAKAAGVPTAIDNTWATPLYFRPLSLGVDIVLHRSEEHTSEEHTSELQSLMRISYAVFCLKKKTKKQITTIQ